jgi:hypothetical protein
MSLRIFHHRREAALLIEGAHAYRLAPGAPALEQLPNPLSGHSEWLEVTPQLVGTGIVSADAIASLAIGPNDLPLVDAAPLDQQYFLYADERRLLMLHLRIPSTDELIPDDQFAAVRERTIVRYGRIYTLTPGGGVAAPETSVDIELDEPLVPISIPLLLSARLTTPEQLTAAGGPWMFRRRGNVDEFL